MDARSLRASLRSRIVAGALAFGVAMAAGVLLGCPLVLDVGRSCGDGWFDPDHEQCDPRDPDESHLDACRDQGWDMDAECDPVTCLILDDEEDCNRCGDGVASGAEECDGNDLRGASCDGGSGVVLCDSFCKLDHSSCPASCGDGFVTGGEECDPNLPSCGADEDCPEGSTCYQLTGECVLAGENRAPNLSCTAYTPQTTGIETKGYASGTISECADSCYFGRDNCSFCGDGVLDSSYWDIVYPSGTHQEFAAEDCDGQEADPELLHDHCKSWCRDGPINADVKIGCDFECNSECSGFVGLGDIVPSPEPSALGCCLQANSPCPSSGHPGVPVLACCSWLEHPNWPADCVLAETNGSYWVCP